MRGLYAAEAAAATLAAEAADAALVRRGRELADDEFMRGEVTAFRRRSGRRPSASVSRGEPVACRECVAVGATVHESFLIHSDPEPVRAREPGRKAVRSPRPSASDLEQEVQRLVHLGYSRETAIYATSPEREQFPRRFDVLGREIVRVTGNAFVASY